MKYILFVLVLLLPIQSFAMTRPIFSALNANTNAAGTRWISFDTGAGVTFNSSEPAMRVPIAASGTVGDAKITSAALAAGASYTYALYKNGIATGQTCTITNPATTCTATGGIISVVPGDTLSWGATPAGGAAGVATTIVSSFVGTNADETFIGGATTVVVSNSATQYYSLFGVDGSTIEASSSIPEPVAGTIDNLYIEAGGVPGIGKTLKFTLYKNGSPTSLTATVTGTGAGCCTANDPTDTVSVSANDLLSIETLPTGTPGTDLTKWSVRLKPTVDGQSPIMVRISPPTATANRFYAINGKSNASSGAIDVASPIAFALSNLYNTFDVPPGGTANYTTTLRQNGANSSLTATVTAAGAPASDNTHTVSIAANDTIGWANTRANSPAASFKQTVSAIAFIQPPAAGTTAHINGFFNGSGWLKALAGYFL